MLGGGSPGRGGASGFGARYSQSPFLLAAPPPPDPELQGQFHHDVPFAPSFSVFQGS